jgi:flagellar hook-associated protein 2
MSSDLTSSVISSGSTQTTSGQIHFSGLGSGTDFDSMITKLVQVESTRMNSLETWKQSWSDKKVAFKALNTKLLSLRTTLQGMSTLGTFLKKTATSGDTGVFTATAGAGAESIPHSISVNQLAQNKIMVTSNGYAATNTNINTTGTAQTFAFTYKGVTTSISVPDGATLNDLKNLVNTSTSYSSNSGVRASVVFDGNNYFLQMRGLDTGSNASLIVSAGTTLAGFSNGKFQITQNNQNAQLKLDGWPIGSTNWLTRQTNTISDLVAGITLSLKGAGTNVSLTSENDDSSIIQNVHTVVDQINQVLSQIKDLTKVDTNTNTGSLLTGNYGLQMINSQLLDAVASKAVGFDYDRDALYSLSQVGVSIDDNEGSATEGQLLVDDTVLATVIASNADGLGQVFAASFIGDTNSADFSYQSYISGITKAGTFDVAYTVAGGVITGAMINGHAAMIDPSTNTITGNSSYDESGLTLKINNLTDGNYSGKVYLKQGKNGEMADMLKSLTDSSNGPLAVLQKNYQTIMDNIDSKIAFEQRRITQYESDLRNRFARLDALLGTYQSQQTSLESQIAQLSSSSS